MGTTFHFYQKNPRFKLVAKMAKHNRVVRGRLFDCLQAFSYLKKGDIAGGGKRTLPLLLYQASNR